MEKLYVKEPLHIFSYNMKEISAFCKSETVMVYKLKIF